jgi:hypothetical protein
MNHRFQPAGFAFVGVACLGLCSLAAAQSTVQRVDVLNRGNNFELEIQTSQPVIPQTQAVTGPDRVVIDFPNAVPGPRLHAIAVNTPHVKGVRMGLFASNPPVARVVVDLNSPQTFQVFPSGKSVIVKIAGAGNVTAALKPVSMAAAAPAVMVPQPPPLAAQPLPVLSAPVQPVPALQVEFRNGKLHVRAEKVMLGQVLRAIGRQIGASVSVPPEAEREPVVTDLGPGPSRDVVSALLNGVPFNVMLIGSGSDLSQVTSIVLTVRAAGGISMPANYSPAPVEEAAPAEPEPEPPSPVPGQETPPPPDTVPPPPQ